MCIEEFKRTMAWAIEKWLRFISNVMLLKQLLGTKVDILISKNQALQILHAPCIIM